MANVGTLFISVVGRTSSFRKSIRQIKRDLKGLRNFTAGAAASFVALGTGIGYFVNRQFESIDATAKMADKFGVTTENLIALQDVAEESGTSMDALARSMQMMIKNIGGNDPLKRLLSVSDLLSRASNASQRLQLAQKIFGKGGGEVVNMLVNLRSKLAESRKETELFGQSFNRLDAANVEVAHKAWGNVRDVLSGIGTQIGIQLAPAANALAEQLTNTATAGGSIGDRVEGAFMRIKAAMGAVGDGTNELISLWSHFKGVIQTTGFGIAKVLSMLTPGKGFLDQLSADFLREAQFSKFDAIQASTDAANQTFSRGLEKWFDDADETMKSRAGELLDTWKVAGQKIDFTGFLGGRKKAKTAKDDFAVKQIDLARTAFGGARMGKKGQTVNAPQLDRTNEILNQILRKAEGSGAAVAG